VIKLDSRLRGNDDTIMKNKVLLIICDGLGYREAKEYNAIAEANTPNLDKYWREYPHALLAAAGEAIGLPEGQMGTSEANHLVMGAGRIIYQNLVKINRAVKNGELKDNPAIAEAFAHVKKYNSVLHIKGIVGPGGVHGHSDHIKGLVLAAKEAGVKNILLHLFTDGRDTAPKSALNYVADLEKFLTEQNTLLLSKEGLGGGSVKIASIGGRYFGMDRDNNYDRIEKHFKIMTSLDGLKYSSAQAAIEEAYKNNLTDEFIEPALIEIGSGEYGCIQANDAVIFANFRSDRAKQLAEKFAKSEIDNLKYVAMTKYSDDLDVRVAFPPEEIKNTLSEVIAQNGLKQLKVTETEKFTHLTFFFNAQKYEPEIGEDRILIDSNKDVKTHDEKPEMKVMEITAELEKALAENKYDFIATNLVNCDMVGHTGNFVAIVKGVEAVDLALGRIINAAQANGYDAIITADHGNAEHTFDTKGGQAITSHTLNPVPFILISEKYKELKKSEGSLADVAPTILKIMELPKPDEMTGKSLF
jgi:2,3-bisphosphoglycerate-independent phosphoglycerate mutase